MSDRNTLKEREKYQLNNWVHSREAALRGRTRADIARDASASLGFKVTESNVIGAEEATGVNLRPRGMAAGNSRDRVAKLAKIIEQHLFVDRSLPVPDDLKDIINHKAG